MNYKGYTRPGNLPAGGDHPVTYNIHHGFNVNGRLDLENVARMIEASGAEIVALQQVQVLLDAWNRKENSVLAGDLNATPGQPEIQLLAEAGLVSVTARLAAGPVHTYSADAPRRQIDYVWISPDLEAEAFDVPRTNASDHLPLVTTVRLP